MLEVNVVELIALCAAMFGMGVNSTMLVFYLIIGRRN